MNYVALQALAFIAIIVFLIYLLFKPKASPRDEYQRGRDDAAKFLADNVDQQSIISYCDYMKSRGTSGPYEAGMMSVINEMKKGTK